LLCCGKCSKWQHIPCHDNIDRIEGRPKRNWDIEEFICRRCRYPAAGDYAKQNGLVSGHNAGRSQYPSYQYGSTPGQMIYNYGQPGSYIGKDARYEQGPSRAVDPLPADSRSSYHPHNALTFSHYQPQQHGFTIARPSQTPPSYPHSPALHPYPAAELSYDASLSSKSASQYHSSSDLRSSSHNTPQVRHECGRGRGL